MPAKAIYQRVLASRAFTTQAEAKEWAKEKKEQYKASDITVKVDIEPADATRRVWQVKVYQKV